MAAVVSTKPTWKEVCSLGMEIDKDVEIDLSGVTVAVCGGGNGAHAAAGMYTEKGATVHLFASIPAEAEKLSTGIESNHGLRVKQNNSDSTKLDYIVTPKLVTSDPALAIPSADIVIIFAPGFAHESILRQVAPHVKPGAAVGSLPAAGGFDLLARHVLAKGGCEMERITLFGAISLPWATRIHEYGKEVHIFGTKAELPFNTHPAVPKVPIANLLTSLHIGTKFVIGKCFLEVTMWPVNPIIHPGIMYGQWHESQWDGKPVAKPPMFYTGCTELAEVKLTEMSTELIEVCKALSSALNCEIDVPRLEGFLLQSYLEIVDKSSLRKMLQTNPAYASLTHPCKKIEKEDGTVEYLPDFSNRYITEDLPHGLVTMRGIAELVNVKTPAIDEVLMWCQEKCGHEYLVDGKICGRDLHRSGAPQRFHITDPTVLMSETPLD
uniref:Opine dehydrogenase domain-containing protein n=1 Tax=Timspurckia oligopyrenoides TaxID=708627 RepID=A0A7S0ZAS9_9RHOD|mmetsp:Transcript_10594/g.19109  ORF Transcript_10594/g.19109 Transcript_10594/m.19109 type:complete len:437 (+) Transcript_10594:56-1366(+)